MNITEKIVKILKGIIEGDEIKPESDLQEDIGLDSLGLVTLLIEIEKEFNIELEETDMDPFELITVSDVCDLVSKYCKNADKSVKNNSEINIKQS